MIDDPKDPKPAGTDTVADQAESEGADINSDIHRVLFDHEMERGGKTTRIPQPRRMRRFVKRLDG